MEMEVALEEEVALVDVIGRRDEPGRQPFGPPETRQKRLTLIYRLTLFVSFPCLRLRLSCDLSHVLAPIM